MSCSYLALSAFYHPQYGDAWCNADMAQLRVSGSPRVFQCHILYSCLKFQVSLARGNALRLTGGGLSMIGSLLIQRRTPCRDQFNRITCQSSVPLMEKRCLEDVWCKFRRVLSRYIRHRLMHDDINMWSYFQDLVKV